MLICSFSPACLSSVASLCPGDLFEALLDIYESAMQGKGNEMPENCGHHLEFCFRIKLAPQGFRETYLGETRGFFAKYKETWENQNLEKWNIHGTSWKKIQDYNWSIVSSFSLFSILPPYFLILCG